MMTNFRQGTAVFLDRWKPDWAAEIILRERVTIWRLAGCLILISGVILLGSASA